MARQRGQSQDTIFGHALELFCQQGYATTPLRDLADRLELTVAGLYYHFPSKDALLVGLVTPLLTDLDALIERAGVGAEVGGQPRLSPPKRRALLGELFDVAMRHRALLGLVTNDHAVSRHPEIGVRLERDYAELSRLLVGADADAHQRILASAALGVLVRPAVKLTDLDLSGAKDDLVDAAVRVLGQAGNRRRSTSQVGQDGPAERTLHPRS